MGSAYARALRSYRRSRDAAFASEAGSPLLPQDRAQFQGLRYFPPSLRYRIEGLAAEPYAGWEAPTFVMQTSDRQARPARRVATLRFALDGRPLALHAYAFADSEPGSLFVPFTDATSGRETYEAGRYLDLAPEDDGTYTLDFNLAYHPLCVYSPFFSCPIPRPRIDCRSASRQVRCFHWGSAATDRRSSNTAPGREPGTDLRRTVRGHSAGRAAHGRRPRQRLGRRSGGYRIRKMLPSRIASTISVITT